MKGLLFTICITLVVAVMSPAFATNAVQPVNVDISTLTPEQQRAVQAVANQMKEKKSDAPAIMQALQGVNKDTIRGWAEAGTEAGKAVGNFAKEIGAVATDFLNSFIGKATFVLVFMSYGGGKLLKFGMDIIWFVALTPFFLYFMYKVFQRFVLQVVVTKEVKYNPNVLLRLLGVNEKTIKVDKALPPDDKDFFWYPIIGWVFIVFCNVVYFSQMWPRWYVSM